uniref:Antitoxin n=1 Tax=Solibacter usitatus (strain Ellin6076) TaxID=234267 RepID=Q023V0_SOLUE
MAQFNIAYAKAHFSELIEKASLGEEITVTKDNRPVAKIVPLRPLKRQPGTGKGKILFLSPDFDAPLEDFAEYQ